MKKSCIIIAEAGVNHNGDLEMAKELVRVAAEAGADYVKFQTFSADKLVTKTAKQAAYQKKNLQSGENDSQYGMLKKLELSRKDHEVLVKTCEYYGINFLSTAFDNENLVYLARDLNLDYIKIPSGELTNYPYLRLAAQLNKPIILSTGMATLAEISDSVKLLENFGVKKDDLEDGWNAVAVTSVANLVLGILNQIVDATEPLCKFILRDGTAMAQVVGHGIEKDNTV